jgi:hypothetical protein
MNVQRYALAECLTPGRARLAIDRNMTQPQPDQSLLALMMSITDSLSFGSASASSPGTKRPQPKAMTFTFFSRHNFPKCRFAWRNGYLHRLS